MADELPEDGMMREIFNMMSRMDLMRGMTFDSRLDIRDACKLPPVGALTPQMYWDMWDRDPIAARVVEIMPKEAFQVQFSVYEQKSTGEAKGTAFDDALLDVSKQLRGNMSWHDEQRSNPICNLLQKAHIDSRVGQYGVILVGIDDGQKLETPADMSAKGGRQLMYARSFPQQYAKIVEWDLDENSRRYMLPTMYELTFSDTKGAVGAPSQANKRVHWSRIVHVSESGDLFSVEPMRRVFDELVGLQKLYCTSPEMYRLGAFPGIGFSTPSQLGSSVKIDEAALQRMMAKYAEGFQRWFATRNLQAQQFSPQVVDPTPQIRVLIEAICILLGIPVRIFMGSERGSLASNQDVDDWNDELKMWQNSVITPYIVVPFYDRLIALGVLPQPAQYTVEWADLSVQNETERLTNANLLMDVLTKYIQGGVESVFSLKDMFVRVLNYTEDEAQAIIDQAMLEFQRQEEEQAAQQADLAAKLATLPPEEGVDVPDASAAV